MHPLMTLVCPLIHRLPLPAAFHLEFQHAGMEGYLNIFGEHQSASLPGEWPQILLPLQGLTDGDGTNLQPDPQNMNAVDVLLMARARCMLIR